MIEQSFEKTIKAEFDANSKNDILNVELIERERVPVLSQFTDRFSKNIQEDYLKGGAEAFEN